jgi:hypothetical protein
VKAIIGHLRQFGDLEVANTGAGMPAVNSSSRPAVPATRSAMTIKAATLDELEFENGGEAELFFVAIRPGTYEYGSRGMMERGVVGKIIVESGDGTAAAESPKEGG